MEGIQMMMWVLDLNLTDHVLDLNLNDHVLELNLRWEKIIIRLHQLSKT